MLATINLSVIKMYYKVLSALWPQTAAQKAFKLFQRTRKLPFKPVEVAFYEKARKFQVVHPKESVFAYEAGNTEGDLVLLVHGWESNAGSMSAIASMLVAQGFHVVALDLPAHGYSRQTHTNLRECTEALRALIYQLRPAKPFSVISHSFGSAVTAMALSGSRYAVENWIMLTSPNRLLDVFCEFKKQIGLGNLVFDELLQRAAALLNESVSEISVEKKAAMVNYKTLTIIHDVHDKVLPFSNAVRLSKVLRDAELYKLKNAGHYRMLHNEGVLLKVNNVMAPALLKAEIIEHELMSA